MVGAAPASPGNGFGDEEAAMDWVDANQLGRRTLTPDQRSIIRGR
jgi:hypothetical protein